MTATRLLLLLLILGRLPQIAGAGPLFVDLDPRAHRADATALRGVDTALTRFAAAVAGGDSALFAGLFDPTRAQLLLGRTRDPDRRLDYGPRLQDWAMETEGGPDTQQELLRRVLAAVPPPVSLDARRAALIHADRTVARRLWPGDGVMPLRIGHKQTRDEHPLLGETLEIALRSDLSWADPRCAPWRRDFRSRIGACPLNSDALQIRPPLVATAREREAWLDSLCRAQPAIAEAGWLKRKLLRWGVASMARAFATLEGARKLWIAGAPETLFPDSPVRAALAGRPPSSPPSDRAVLRLLFLRDSRRENRWLLALAWLSPMRRESLSEVYLEPGFASWTRRYSHWRAEALERIERAEDQR